MLGDTQPPPDSGSESRFTTWSRRVKRVSIVVLCVMVLVLIWWLTSVRSPLSIREVVVVGASADLEPVIVQLAAVEPGQSFASVNRADVVAAVTVIDGINGAELSWGWPSVLRIEVAEQLPFAAARSQDKFVVLDRSGEVIRTSATRPDQLPLVSGKAFDGRATVLAVVEAMPDPVSRRVREYVATSAESVDLVLKGGARVDWGDSSQPIMKSQVLLEMLQLRAQRYNVSVPQRPAAAEISRKNPTSKAGAAAPESADSQQSTSDD